MKSSAWALLVIGLVVLCATVLCALGQLPSEAATAILGGAVVQAVQLVRPSRRKGDSSVPPPPAASGGGPAGGSGGGLPPVGPVVGMLGGGMAGHLLGLM